MRGMLSHGNIDLTTRPQVINPDGSISTIRSIGVNIDNKELLIPTVSDDGRIMSNNEAVETYRKTGKHLGIFDSPASATTWANVHHADKIDPFASGSKKINNPLPPPLSPELASPVERPVYDMTMPMQRSSQRRRLTNHEAFERVMAAISKDPTALPNAKKEGSGYEGFVDMSSKAVELLGGGGSTQTFDPNFGHPKLPPGMIPTKETAAKIKAAGPLRPSAEMKIGMMPDDFGLSGFFSKAKPLIAAIKQPVMQRRDLLRMLQGKGVRNEELKWTGLLDELNKDGKITKQELNEVMEKAPRFKEVVQTTNRMSETKTQLPAGHRFITFEEADELGISATTSDTIVMGPNGQSFTADNQTEAIAQAWDMLNPSYPYENETIKWSSSEFNLPGPRTDQKNILIQLDVPLESNKGKYIVFDPVDDSIKHVANTEREAELWRTSMRDQHPRELRIERGNNVEPTKFEDPNHWDEPNVLGWLRTNKRSTLDGESVLHIDEWQSQWGNKARKYGIESPEDITALNKLTQLRLEAENLGIQKDKLIAEKSNLRRNSAGGPTDWKEVDRIEKLLDVTYQRDVDVWHEMNGILNSEAYKNKGKTVKPAPFIGHGEAELLAKRALLEAVSDPNVKHLTWTTGEQQAERYGLDRHFTWIRYDPDKKLLQAKPKDGSPFLSKTVEPKDLGEHIGDELASNLLKTTPMKTTNPADLPAGVDSYRWHRLTGPDLKVEDKGKREAYDVIFKNQVERWSGAKADMKNITKGQPEYVKNYHISNDHNNKGFYVSEELKGGGWSTSYDIPGFFNTAEAAQKEIDAIKTGGQEVWSIPITDALREKLKKGFPMYAIAGGSLPSLLNKKDKTNKPLPPPPMPMLKSH